MINIRELDLRKVNSITKYPSIPTYHELGEKGKIIAKRIRYTFPREWFNFDSDKYDSEIDEITERLENITGWDSTTPTEEFDIIMQEFYDFGDHEIAPFGEWPPNKMCWISTIL